MALRSSLPISCLMLVLLLRAVAATAQEGEVLPLEPVPARIEAVLAKSRPVAGERLVAVAMLHPLYAERAFAPLCTSDRGPTRAAQTLLAEIDRAPAEGLLPARYHRDALATLTEALASCRDEACVAPRVDYDLLLSDAFLRLAHDYAVGVLDLETHREKPFRVPEEVDLAALLREADAKRDAGKPLRALLPTNGGYPALRSELAHMRHLAAAGGWPRVPDVPRGEKLEPYAIDPRILAVRRRLEATGELPGGQSTHERAVGEITDGADFYGDELVEAVMAFQRTHGLDVDGVIGRGTVAAMNVSAARRVCQLIVNLDRLRALSERLAAPRYVLVNLTAPEAMLFEEGREVLDMRAIVGRTPKKFRSPILTNTIKYLVFSPKWHVPVSIAVNEKLPKLRKNPEYLQRLGIKVYRKGERDAGPIDSTAVDWHAVEASEESFPYHFVQNPGRGNALGYVKFMFPNKHSVYLHDTSDRHLFARQSRTLSHGCIRIQKPVELAELLLRDQEKWTRERIEKAMHRGVVQDVGLTEPVPISIQYLSAFAADGGPVRYFPDVYGYDREAARILCKE